MKEDGLSGIIQFRLDEQRKEVKKWMIIRDIAAAIVSIAVGTTTKTNTTAPWMVSK